MDFDILIEIGYSEEEDHPLTLKQVLLLNISSRTTVRRRLLRLIEQGVVRHRADANDRRSSLLTIFASNLKLLGNMAQYSLSLAPRQGEATLPWSGQMRNWKIIEIRPRQWVWERDHLDGTSTRTGPFTTLAACVKDAEREGFDPSKLERRMLPREPGKT